MTLLIISALLFISGIVAVGLWYQNKHENINK
jgi:hypothetical protein